MLNKINFNWVTTKESCFVVVFSVNVFAVVVFHVVHVVVVIDAVDTRNLPVVVQVVVVVIVDVDPRNLPLEFGQNRMSNSWDFDDVEFLVVGGSWWYEVI